MPGIEATAGPYVFWHMNSELMPWFPSQGVIHRLGQAARNAPAVPFLAELEPDAPLGVSAPPGRI
jgi:hypothetical protein